MNIRIRISRSILQLGAFLKTLPIVIMKPDDLIEFSRQNYGKPTAVDGWSEDEFINQGLEPSEIELIKKTPEMNGKLLLLGIGGGREAIQFANMGFEVTGVDYIPDMVKRAKKNATKRGLEIEGLVQDISKLSVPSRVYDVVWISRSMYSCVPTRTKRIEMVKRIYQALQTGGYFLCQFDHGQNNLNPGKGEKIRRIIANSPFGNKAYESGDMLWLNVEFLHVFISEEEIRSELEAGGFFIDRINMGKSSKKGSAVCIKKQ